MRRFASKLVASRGDWIRTPTAGGPPDTLIEGVIHGTLASKSNNRRIYRFGGAGGGLKVIPEKANLDFKARVEAAAYVARLTKCLGPPLTCNLRIDAVVYQENLRRDLDIELLCDALQRSGVIQNDRQIWMKLSIRQVDRENPRVEFRLRERPDFYLTQAAGELRVQPQEGGQGK